jgi:protein involved in gliding motility SprA
VQQLANGGVNILQNEQALSMQIRNLFRGEARGVFKNFNNDLRQYKAAQHVYTCGGIW